MSFVLIHAHLALIRILLPPACACVSPLAFAALCVSRLQV